MNGEEGSRFGPYIVFGEIARGGQGVVMKARHEQLGTVVALKMLLHKERRNAIKHFRQEAKVLAQLNHPNLLKVTDLGEHNGLPFLAMEFVDGEELSGVIQKQGIPSVNWTADVLSQVADALHYCHSQGIVHRDLKPPNVLIERSSGRPIVVDFGLVKRDPEQMKLSSLDGQSMMTKTGMLKGTPKYMAPEQVSPTRFGPVSPRTDVYALGATLYYLLTGEPPLEASSLTSALVAVVNTAPQDPRKKNSDVPEAVAALCLRCLAKEPEERPATAEEFATALREATQGAEANGRPRRTLLWVSLAVNVLILALLGVAAGIYASASHPADETPSSKTPLDAVSDAPATPKEPYAWAEPLAILQRNRRKLPKADPAAREAQRDLALDWLRKTPPDHADREMVDEILFEARMLCPTRVIPDPDWRGRGKIQSQAEGGVLAWFEGPSGGSRVYRWETGRVPTDWRMVQDDAISLPVSAAVWQPRGSSRWLASGSWEQNPRLVARVVSGGEASVTLSQGGPVRALVTSQAWLIAGTGEGRVVGFRWADIAAGTPEPAWASEEHRRSPVNHLAFSSDGTRLWSVSGENVDTYNAVHEWAVTDDSIELQRKTPFRAEVRWVERHPTRNDQVLIGLNQIYEFFLLDSKGERTVTFTASDIKESSVGLRPPVSHASPLAGAAFAPDGKLLFTVASRYGDQVGELRTWDATTGKPRLPPIVDPVGEPGYSGVSVSADGRWLFTFRLADASFLEVRQLSGD